MTEVTAPPTIIEFLNARLDEDEFAARQPSDTAWQERERERGSLVARIVSARGGGGALTRWYLADIRAKRGIIQIIRDEHGEEWSGEPRRDGVLIMMASVYADHPDFRAEWVGAAVERQKP